MRQNNSQRGQAIITSVVFLLFISLSLVLGISSSSLREFKITEDSTKSKQSYFLAEAALEDIYYRLQNGKQVSSTEVLSLNGGTATTTVTNTSTGKRLVITSTIGDVTRKLQADLILGTGISFHYGIQSGNGGFTLANSSSVTGNVFSGGSVIGAGGNMVYGDIISSGSNGSVYGIHATGTVYAHNIGLAGNSTTIDKDAYYQNKINTTVNGTSYPNSPDQPVAELPISDEQINEWEAEALAGGVMLSSSCDSYSSSTNTCTISSSKTLGPKKIPFNLLIKSSSGVLTVAGPLWVTGNITAQTGPTIKMSSGLGSQNVAVIADNPANRLTSSIIDIGQSTIFSGSGSPGSFVFMISQNNSAENGGSTDAVSMNQGASALVAYASHGQITLSQSANVKEVTAYRINLTQSANVTYDTGLPNTVFSAGPSGGYQIQSWTEIK